MTSNIDRLNELAEYLELYSTNDDNTLFGDFHGVPAAFTVLSLDPPSFMFQLRLKPVEGIEWPEKRDQEVSDDDSDVGISVHNKCACISFYDIRPLETFNIKNMLTTITQSIVAAGYARPDVCLQCSRPEDTELIFADGRPSQVCNGCLSDAKELREQTEAELNSPKLTATLSLPVIGLVSAGLWAVFWFAIEWLLDYFSITFIEINYFSMAMMLAFFGVIGWSIGWPLGAMLRRTPLVRQAPRAVGTILTVSLVAVGEMLHAAIMLIWFLGIVDLAVAPLIALQMLMDTPPFWLLCKLALAVAVGIFCCTSAARRESVSLGV